MLLLHLLHLLHLHLLLLRPPLMLSWRLHGEMLGRSRCSRPT